MKKRHLFWIIPSGLIVLIFLVILFGHLISPVKSKKLIKESKNLKYLTEKQVAEELDYLKYYFQNYYVAYDQMVEQGFDIDQVCKKILEKIMKEQRRDKTLPADYFRAYMAQVVKESFPFVDLHFSINGVGPQSQMSLYYSDIFVKKIDGKWTVVKNQPDEIPDFVKNNLKIFPPSDIKAGQEYTGSENNLYEWFDGGEKIYRYAVLTDKKLNQTMISIDGKNVLTPIQTSYYVDNAFQSQGFIETKDTLYLSLSNFVFNSGSEKMAEKGKRDLQAICDNAKNYSKGKKNIIIDLRNNGGGSILFRNVIFANLMYNNTEIDSQLIRKIASIGTDNSQILVTPQGGKKNRKYLFNKIKRYFKLYKYRKNKVKYDFEALQEEAESCYDRIEIKNAITSLFYPERKLVDIDYYIEDRDFPPLDFMGDIYILTNNDSASSSELSIAMLKTFEKTGDVKVHLIGENTCGAVFYVGPSTVLFPYSGSWIYCPTVINHSKDFDLPDFHGEGKGWYPEYWVNNWNLVNTLSNLIDDPELAQALEGLETHHL